MIDEDETLVRVVCDGPRPFDAGFIVKGGRVTLCAPILKKALAGLTVGEARAAIARRGWKATITHVRLQPGYPGWGKTP